jgi:hypothetical protein
MKQHDFEAVAAQLYRGVLHKLRAATERRGYNN